MFPRARATRSFLAKALVVLEHNNKTITPSSLAAVGAASKLGDVTALVAGAGCGSVAEEASKLKGISSVIAVDSAEYEHGLPETLSTLVKKIQDDKKFSHIVAAHTSYGKSFLPRVAAACDSSIIADVIGIKDETTFVRSTYAGNALATVKSTKDAVKFLSVRPTSFDKAATGGSAKIETAAATGDSGLAKWIAEEVDTSGKVDLTAARVVIGGGRGLKNAENFKMLYDMAAKIGNAAVGATRAVVDAGYVSNDMQVGQTGKIVAPELYIAVGLSGAIQHLAGMKDSKVIACINTDPEAPIFTVSDYGLEADLFTAIPEMMKKL
jgi:electron transfer flavoprotein alpha subunit